MRLRVCVPALIRFLKRLPALIVALTAWSARSSSSARCWAGGRGSREPIGY